MSQSYEYHIGAQTSRIPGPGRVNLTRSDKSSGFLPRSSCKWSPETRDSLLQFFLELRYPYRHYFQIPFEEPLRSEIRRFLISLDAYLESPNPVIPEKDILYGATELDFAERLKRIKRKSFETTWNVQHFELPSWWDKVPSYRINDIGDIFNYSYLIFWYEPEPDDYLHGMTAVEIDPTTLSDFKDILRCILPEEGTFNELDESEVLSVISSSMSYDPKSKKHSPHYMLKPNYLYFAKNIGEVERVVLRVSPNNTRDSVLVNPAALNTISAMDKQLMEILSRMRGHIHLRDKDRVTRRLRKLYKDYPIFLQRDLRKEGITKPRQLLKAMLEVLHETYPRIKAFQYTSFYDDFSLRVNNEVLFPQRGHGLGMANALTTLMQIVVHNLVSDRLSHMSHDGEARCLCLNDDFLVGFKEYEDLENYWDIEDEVMAELSLIRAPEKSFQSEGRFVLAERYFNGEEDKKLSYQIRESLMPLACYNIAHAKDYFRSVQTYVSSDVCAKYIEEIVDLWGYEFFKDEFRYPYLTGGWRNEQINSVDLSLIELEELDYSAKVGKALIATTATPYRKKYRGEKYISPAMSQLGRPDIPEKYHDHFDYLPLDQINDKYGRILSRSNKEFTHYWDSLLKNRETKFKFAPELTFEQTIKFLIRDNPITVFYPIRTMIKEYVPANIGKSYIKDIYIDPNPKIALVAKYNGIKYDFKEEFSIQFTRADEFTKKSQNLYPKDIERTLKNQFLSPMMTGKTDEYLYPQDMNNHPENIYLNPIRIGNAAAVLDWGKGYPIIHEEYVSPIIADKREVFGRLFSIQEQRLISDYKINRKLIKIIAEYMSLYPEDSLADVIEKLLELSEETADNQVYSDREEFDDDGIKVTHHDTVRGIIDVDEVRKVNMADLLLSPDLIWSIISNPSGYEITERDTADIVGNIRIAAMLVNLPHGSLFEGGLDIDTMIDLYGPRVELLARRSNLRELFTDHYEGVLESNDEFDYGNIWDDD